MPTASIQSLVWIVESSGSAKGNPGRSSYGAVVRDPETRAVLLERSGCIGIGTSAAAEYLAIQAGLQAALDLGATRVEVRTCSQLCAEQMNGGWQVRSDAVRPHYVRAGQLAERFEHCRVCWVPKETCADPAALAREALADQSTFSTRQRVNR
jgi:ribonuclease HI